MLDARAIAHHPPAVQRLLVWSALGCRLVREAGRWRLEKPADMPRGRGPAPTPIQDRTARAAIAAGAQTGAPADLFTTDHRQAA
ncbi:hypothetical protein FV232_00985 [Methylobacterium sp. WL30]|uniref:hypothetical protein n=1 Tax=unclassified Methylobacterium TaxID=2615210 RepID=UPI0011CCDD9F|nr:MULTISPECIES: hypothetical protein [unclassified Methylobacterium]TXN38970.1 hypothetical protein FV225_11615 [Methylobacterium sp. WL93]TXN52257.1 hypothetical protein FV227_04185 [Methylobacterium sp. WL119]TXN70660.1 hypothetical protein FV232_00985 [Methylobacterium sp. WL30]